MLITYEESALLKPLSITCMDNIPLLPGISCIGLSIAIHVKPPLNPICDKYAKPHQHR